MHRSRRKAIDPRQPEFHQIGLKKECSMRQFEAAGRLAAVTGLFSLLAVGHTASQSQVRTLTISPNTIAAVRDWDVTVNRMVRSHELEIRRTRSDTLLTGRTIEQLDQYYKGVRVWGGSVSRQLIGSQAVSAFGQLYADITVDVVPGLTQDDAKATVERIGGAELGPDRLPELVILPTESTFRLVWVGEIATIADSLRIFLDAKTGAVVQTYSIREHQGPTVSVGHGVGVLQDTKKVSSIPFAGTFIASDPLRPPVLNTYNMRSNFTRVIQFLNGTVTLNSTDLGSDSDNDWTDAAVVDAHVYAGFTYDYYFKRFGRRGLDNANIRILSLVHPVSRDAFFGAPPALDEFYLNAGYYGSGVIVYGEGLPSALILPSGQRVNYFAGALDIAGHELTHGVTDYSSRLEYVNESGALNESFSDVMGTSIEFFYQTPGVGLRQADYLIGEDILTPAIPGALAGGRSLENPGLFGQPDHYSKRVILPPTPQNDNGGVHINSGIPNQAFYLAIEGGTNRTSGIRVQGVGGANREQIEKVYYRAFAQLMPSNATFSLARAVTLQAAQDLYGVNSPPYNAVRDGWTAVGVN
jgi:bacillolysin